MFGLRRHFLLDPSVTFLNNRKWGDARGPQMLPDATDLARLKTRLMMNTASKFRLFCGMDASSSV